MGEEGKERLKDLYSFGGGELFLFIFRQVLNQSKGSSRCAGKTFATAELLYTLALFILNFEIVGNPRIERDGVQVSGELFEIRDLDGTSIEAHWPGRLINRGPAAVDRANGAYIVRLKTL